jgi:hypothetical protein
VKNIKSFYRQLSYYGFKRFRRGPFLDYYYCENFTRGDSSLVQSMQPRTPSSPRGPKTPKSPKPKKRRNESSQLSNQPSSVPNNQPSETQSSQPAFPGAFFGSMRLQENAGDTHNVSLGLESYCTPICSNENTQDSFYSSTNCASTSPPLTTHSRSNGAANPSPNHHHSSSAPLMARPDNDVSSRHFVDHGTSHSLISSVSNCIWDDIYDELKDIDFDVESI